MVTKMWVSALKGPLDTEHFTQILKRLFVEGGVAPMGIQSWRHVSVAVVDAHIKDQYKAGLGVGENAIIDCQRGHNSATANAAYGGTGGYDADRNTENQYKEASTALHLFWEVSHPCTPNCTIHMIADEHATLD